MTTIKHDTTAATLAATRLPSLEAPVRKEGGPTAAPALPRDAFDLQRPDDRIRDGIMARPGCWGGGVSPFYRAQLRGMTDQQLQSEKMNQQINLWVAELLGDHAGAAQARAKLNAIGQEETRRLFEGGGVEMALYRAKLNGMSDQQLNAEERKQFGNYIMAMLRGDTRGAERALQKLEAIEQEKSSREWTWFPRPSDPPYHDRELNEGPLKDFANPDGRFR
jgi:hypothetical protein